MHTPYIRTIKHTHADQQMVRCHYTYYHVEPKLLQYTAGVCDVCACACVCVGGGRVE